MEQTLAYLAGCIDSDGFMSIKKSNYGRRIKNNCFNTTYQAIVGLKQITPQVPKLLKSTFGGCQCVEHIGGNRKDLFRYQASNIVAYNIAESLLPYLLVKKEQANCLIELQSTNNAKFRSHTYWSQQDRLSWKEHDKMFSIDESVILLGYKNREMLLQAIRMGTILSYKGMIPGFFIDRLKLYRSQSKDGRLRTAPAELISWREALYQRMRELNKNGVNGTPVYQRIGPFATKT